MRTPGDVIADFLRGPQRTLALAAASQLIDMLRKEGFVIVPIEATAAMINAGPMFRSRAEQIAVWKAMVEAAP